MIELSLQINGISVQQVVPAQTTLLSLLQSLDYAGLRQGCNTESCGACTVWLDERPILSCSTLAAHANGRRVTTLEGSITRN